MHAVETSASSRWNVQRTSYRSQSAAVSISWYEVKSVHDPLAFVRPPQLTTLPPKSCISVQGQSPGIPAFLHMLSGHGSAMKSAQHLGLKPVPRMWPSQESEYECSSCRAFAVLSHAHLLLLDHEAPNSLAICSIRVFGSSAGSLTAFDR